MFAKDVRFDVDAPNRIMMGVNTLAEAVVYQKPKKEESHHAPHAPDMDY